MEPLITFHFTDIVGYAASGIVLISFLMRNIRTLRILNTFGCVLFVAYGCMLDFSIPIIFTNTAIACINVYYLLKMKKNILNKHG